VKGGRGFGIEGEGLEFSLGLRVDLLREGHVTMVPSGCRFVVWLRRFGAWR